MNPKFAPYKGTAKMQKHLIACEKRSVELQKQTEELRAEEQNEYDVTDPFVNDGEIEKLPKLKLGLRASETIGPVRKRRRTVEYCPVETVCLSEEEEEEEEEESDEEEEEEEYLPDESDESEDESEDAYNSESKDESKDEPKDKSKDESKDKSE